MNQSIIGIFFVLVITGVAIITISTSGILTVDNQQSNNSIQTSSVSTNINETEISLMIYNDSDCTTPLKSINWGILEKGEAINFTIYLKNIGNKVCIAKCNFTNWSPKETEAYIAINWDSEGVILKPEEVHKAIISLDASESFTGISDFNFDINVYIT